MSNLIMKSHHCGLIVTFYFATSLKKFANSTIRPNGFIEHHIH